MQPSRPVTAVPIHCPIEAATLKAWLAGDAAAIERDPTPARMLEIIGGENSLGDFGLYKSVVEISVGYERFVPTSGASPARGSAGAAMLSPTVILTTYEMPAFPSRTSRRRSL